MIAADFDKFRADYDSMSFADVAAFYDRMYHDHPDQNHFSLSALIAFMERVKPARVLEIGGWDGAAAMAALPFYPSTKWTNLEICRHARERTPETDNYKAPELHGFPWAGIWCGFDALVASHTFEHMALWQIEAMIEAVPDSRALYCDMPPPPKGTWAGTTAAHVLGTDWESVAPLIESWGYKEIMRLDGRQDQQAVRVYTR